MESWVREVIRYTHPNVYYKAFNSAGFWQGWIPRAIGEVSFVALASTITFLINKYILSEKDVQHFTSHVSSFIASSIVYPFNVVGNCVIVSRFVQSKPGSLQLNLNVTFMKVWVGRWISPLHASVPKLDRLLPPLELSEAAQARIIYAI